MNTIPTSSVWFSKKTKFLKALDRNEIKLAESTTSGHSLLEILSMILFNDKSLKSLIKLLLTNFLGILHFFRIFFTSIPEYFSLNSIDYFFYQKSVVGNLIYQLLSTYFDKNLHFKAADSLNSQNHSLNSSPI